MLRFAALLAAAALGTGGLFADFAPRQYSYDCHGEWQLGSDFRLGRLAAVIEDGRWAPELLGTTSAGMMNVMSSDGPQFSYSRVKTDGDHWYIYSQGEHMGMISGTTGRVLLETPRGLFQGRCAAL